MDSVHISINLSARSAKHDVADAAQPVNVCESQHGNDDSDREGEVIGSSS